MMLRKLMQCAGVALAMTSVSAYAETVVISADSYLDVAAGEVISPAVIVIDNGEIVAINPDESPTDARSVDLSGRVLVPGLFDMHTHLTFDIAGDWADRPVHETSALATLRGADNARKTLMAGFTTVRDLGAAAGFTDVALMTAVERGWIVGPDIIPTGHALSITGGHCESTGFVPGVLEGSWRTGTADGVDEVLKATRYQIKHGAKAIKICATAGVLSFEGPVGAQQYTIEEMTAIAEEAHRHGFTVAAHAHGTEGIIAASEAGIDSIEHNSIMTEEAAEILKRNGTYVVPNIHLLNNIDRDILPDQIRAKMDFVAGHAESSFERAVDMEVPILFGTDSAVYPHGDNAKEFAAQVALGQAPLAAIRSATIDAANFLGLADRGNIAVGMRADIIAVTANPLDAISTLEDVVFVMKHGEIFKGP